MEVIDTAMRQNPLPPREASRESRPDFLGEQHQHKSRLQWWYRISLFPEPPATASLEQLEYFRRGRTTSQIILVLTLVLMIPVPVAILLSIVAGAFGLILLAVLVLALALMFFCAALNRAGRVTTAALIIILVFIAGPTADIATTPGGVSYSSLPAFHTLLIPVAVAASTLPRRSVPFIALINCAIIILSLTVFPQARGANMVPRADIVIQVTSPIVTQALITAVSMLWASGISRSLRRANRAEEIARLEFNLAQRAMEDRERSNRLEESVQQITEVHRRVANGDLSARVPLTDRNILWQISGLLNNLLTRFQSLRQRSLELEQTNTLLRTENARLLQALNQRQSDSSFSNRTMSGRLAPSNRSDLTEQRFLP
jgi:hypothetical protein